VTPDDATWVRAHAWPGWLHTQWRHNPDHVTTCGCQWGPTGHCGRSRHAECWFATGRPGADHGPSAVVETWIATSRGEVAGVPGVTGRVWLADRVCRWRCPCTCHDPALERRPGAAVQLDLFNLSTMERR